ncbi:MAG: alpha-2-macroglobulin family protein [bacterium]
MLKKFCFNFLLSLLLTLSFSSQLTYAQFDSAEFNTRTGPLEITRITPTGEDVPASREVVLKFNMPVVPVGRMERTPDEIPITISPPLNGQWRWLNTSSLALQLGDKEQMKKSTKYSIEIKPEFVTDQGNQMKDGLSHTFITERVKVTYHHFSNWKGPGHPVISLTFNQKVNIKSALEHLSFQTNNNEIIAVIQGEGLKNEYSASINIEPSKELEVDTEYLLKVTLGIISEEGPESGIEDRTIVVFHTFPEFRFIGITGLDNNDKEVFIDPTGQGDGELSPLKGVTLKFTTPVTEREEGPKLEITPDLAGRRDDYDPWVNTSTREYCYLSPYKQGNQYELSLPEALKGDQEYHIKSTPDFHDAFGRSLKEQIDLVFKTSHRPPELFIKNVVSVLEKNVETHVPVVITNLKKLDVRYRLIDEPSDFWLLNDFCTDEVCGGDFAADQNTSFSTDPVEDVAYYYPFKIRDILQGKSGAIAGIINPVPPVKNHCPFQFFSQVTNLTIHTKLGHYNTLVWVTRLDNGQPVPEANVDLFLRGNTSITSSKTDENGLAMLKGVIDIDPYLYNLRGNFCSFGLVRVTTPDDSAILPLVDGFDASSRNYSGDYYDGEEGYEGEGDYYYDDYSSRGYNRVKYSYMRAWGTTAQGVYRLGDTIDYKIYVRDQDNRKFIAPELTGYHLVVKDPTDKVVHEINKLTLSDFGSIHGSFTLPKEGMSGWYYFYLDAKLGGVNPHWMPLRVLVTDFTPAPFKVQTAIKGQVFKYGDEVSVDTMARLHSGGPYGKASARITASLKPTSFSPKDTTLSNFYFSVWDSVGSQGIFQEEKELDDKGDLASSFSLTDSNIISGSIIVESAVRDDRGKYIASTSSAKYMGRNRLVGLYQEAWTLEVDKKAEFEVVVVDEKGMPVADAAIDIVIEYDRVTGSRVKGSGNAYLMKYTHSREEVAKFNLISQDKPLGCKFTPQEPGSYQIIARITDSAGLSHSSSLYKYAVGKGNVLWEMPNDNSLTIIPAQAEYKVNERAKFMVKNPYPGAEALITIERLGVMKKWTQVFDTYTPIIEFEIEPDYVPGFYLSVVIHSPRVDKPLEGNNVDLGKPAFKIGYQKIIVNDPYKQLTIIAKTDKEVYKPRDKVTLSINVVDINKNHPQTEVAVVVLDEAVLDLIQGGINYYDPYKGFYKLCGLDMENYNLLVQLLGRQKYEKKGANSGGGGGGLDFKMRSLFKFISYWNPKIYPDENGNASVSFDLPDNLTGWRVLALAMTKDDLMGLGQAHFVTTQFTEIRPALPNQVTEGDSFKAVFTVMNRTDSTRNLKVTINTEGETIEAEPLIQEIKAEPYVRNKVYLPIKVKKDGKITLKVTAGDEIDTDGLIVDLPVYKKQAIEAAATYGTTTAEKVSERFEFPKNMRTDTGKVSVVVSPAIISSLEGAFGYIRAYPYSCWEQRLTTGVMAMHYLNLRPYLAKSFEWPDAKEIIQDMLIDAPSFQAPNGGMCYYIPGDVYVSPYLSAYTAIAFNWLKENSYNPDPKIEESLHKYLLDLLRRDTFPSFFTKGMSSTVRAVALAALAQNNKVNTDDLERYLPHVEYMDLFGKAHYLLAATYLKDTEDIQIKVYHMIMAHANETGGKVIFSDSIYGKDIGSNADFGRILTSEIRTNAAVLSAILSMEEGVIKFNPSKAKDNVNQVVEATTAQKADAFNPTDTAFKVVRYITQSRKSRDHWENTQENVFCMHALTTFSKIYDTDIPNYTVTASMDEKEFGQASFDDFRDTPEELKRPILENDPGRKAEVKLTKDGPGRLYYSARLFYSPAELKVDPINSGIEAHREYYVERDGHWILLNESLMKIKQGELVRVEIFISLPSARNFVVVADPVPGGLEPVNRDLATTSIVDADKDTGLYSGSSWWYKYGDWYAYAYSRWSFYHKELLHHSVRFYSDYLSAGNYHLTYLAQAIAPGEFYAMPLHAEEMYDSDVFGQGVPGLFEIEPNF